MRGSVHPLGLYSGWWSWVAIFILAVAHDMLDVVVPWPLDGIGYHEAPHQFCIVLWYSAGLQDALAARVPCFKCSSVQCLCHHVTALLLQAVKQRPVLCQHLLLSSSKNLLPVLKWDSHTNQQDLFIVLVHYNTEKAFSSQSWTELYLDSWWP